MSGRVRHYLEDSDDPIGGLVRFFTSVLRPHPNERKLRGCLLTTTSGMDAATPDIRSAIASGFATIELAFQQQLHRAVAAGQLDAETDIEATAKGLLISFQGLLVLARSGSSDLHAGIEATFRGLALNA